MCEFFFGKGYIEVFDSNPDAMYEATKNSNSNDSTNQQDDDSWYEPVVRLRGLPYKSSKEDVIKFFSGKSRFNNGGKYWIIKDRQRLDVTFSFFKDENDYISLFLGLNHLVGLDIAQNGVHISSSKPAGEAFVAFTNMDNALRALEFNRMNMGHRYGKQSAKTLPIRDRFSHPEKKRNADFFVFHTKFT